MSFFARKMSHSAEKCKRGTLWGLLTDIQLQNINKLEGGYFGDNGKFSISRKGRKKTKGGPSGFVGFLEKVKRGPFTLIRSCRLRLKSKKPKGDPLE